MQKLDALSSGNLDKTLTFEHARSDESIISGVLRGEKDLYAMIMRKYSERLFRITRAYVRDEDEAEDVVQQAYVLAYQQLPRLRQKAHFSTWLTRIAINEALARVKRRRRCVAANPNAPAGQDALFEHRSLAGMQTPEQEAINGELKQILERAIDALPEKYRTVYTMREIEGMSVSETAECLGISAANVKVRLNRAKEMLRTDIGAFYDKGDIFEFHLVRCDRIAERVLKQCPRYHFSSPASRPDLHKSDVKDSHP